MNNETIFEGCIIEIDSYLNMKSQDNIMFKIINFNNLFFFAEEISTGCIFPIYSIAKRDENESKKYNEYNLKNHNSYLSIGKYYVFFPLESKELFKFCFQERFLEINKKGLSIPTIDEINDYLESNEDDIDWQNSIKDMESSNQFMKDLELIKEKIAELKEGQTIESLNIDKYEPQYINYIPKIDLSSIKDMGYDLSTQDDLCNLIGREDEIKRVIKSVAIKGKSVILLGDPGVGKTSIPEKLALDIRNGNCKFLKDKIIFSLNTGNLVSGTKFRGAFEEKLQSLIDFCKENKGRIILFIDEIHTLCGLGATDGSAIDAMNILKPYISNGDLTIIGATTKEEYEKHLSKDPAFLRRFENIEISSPTKEMTIQIMLAHIKDLENKYNIKINLQDDEILEIVNHIFEITDGKNAYVAGNIRIENPTLAKNILENIFAEAVYNEKEFVEKEDIELSIEEYDELSLEFISEFGYDLSKQLDLCNLVGREKELEKIIKAIAIEENSVLLVGDPGTGKTSIVEKLALDIKNNNCDFLKDKTIFYLNPASLSAGTKFHGEFEEKMNKLINSCRKNKGKIILFIDEIHTLYGLGRTNDSSIDAMNILKPYISNGDLTIIGATTKMEYEKYMANDPAFLRRFENIEISPINEDDKVQILISYIKDLETKYNIKINLNEITIHELMKYIVEITETKYQTVKGDVKVENPTISKRLIENAFSDAKYHKKDFVTIDDIYMSIIDCDKLPINFRKESAQVLKDYITNYSKKEYSDILDYAKAKQKLMSSSQLVKIGF